VRVCVCCVCMCVCVCVLQAHTRTLVHAYIYKREHTNTHTLTLYVYSCVLKNLPMVSLSVCYYVLFSLSLSMPLSFSPPCVRVCMRVCVRACVRTHVLSPFLALSVCKKKALIVLNHVSLPLLPLFSPHCFSIHSSLKTPTWHYTKKDRRYMQSIYSHARFHIQMCIV